MFVSDFVLDFLCCLIGSFIVSYLFLIIVLSKLFPRVFSASTSKMTATDSVGSVDWSAAILDSVDPGREFDPFSIR